MFRSSRLSRISGPLRARAGVDAEVGVVVAVAVLDHDVVADLEADAVAVVVPRRHAADGEAVAVLEEDAAGVVAVEALVVGLVAVEREVLDDDVGGPLGGQQREHRRAGRLAGEPEVLAEAGVEPEAVARAGDERALDDDRAAVVRVLGAEDDAVADLEPARVLQGDLAVVPVGVVGQADGPRRDLGEDRVGARCRSSRTREGRTTAFRRVYVPGRSRTVPPPSRATWPRAAWMTLSSRPVRSASLPSVADGERQPLVPVRLEGVVAVGRPRVGDRRAVVGPGRCRPVCGRQSRRGQTEDAAAGHYRSTHGLSPLGMLPATPWVVSFNRGPAAPETATTVLAAGVRCKILSVTQG